MSAQGHVEREVDVALREAMVLASDGIDFDRAKEAIADGIRAIGAQMKALSKKKYDRMQPQDIARSLAHTIKGNDELYRLLQFAKGAPDSRPDLGRDWLRDLSNDQLAIVAGWIEAKERRG